MIVVTTTLRGRDGRVVAHTQPQTEPRPGIQRSWKDMELPVNEEEQDKAEAPF
jgi:hypothetical protein